jgi:HAMP domain-containing protein
MSASSQLRRLLLALLSAAVIAAGAAIGYVAGKPSASPPLRVIAASAQTVHRGMLQSPVPIAPLKP